MTQGEDDLVADIVQRLLSATVWGDEISLDAIGEAVGAQAVSYEDIDQVISAVEEAGRNVTQPTVDVTGSLKLVLAAAREARARSGRTPSVQELEQTTGLDRVSVLTALRFADTLKR